MKIAIIGAGFTGLSAAYQLLKHGHQVSIFEKDSLPGGLAIGYYEEEWQWTLEKHYHHWFTNDQSVLNLAKELDYQVIIKRPKTSIYSEGSIYQLDSPLSILKFPKLSLYERIRMSIVLGLLRYNPIWKILEPIPANSFLEKTMGKNPYEKIWQPQLKNKFGKYVNEISLAWFWARIKKRTPSLAYPKGGFLKFAERIAEEIEKNGGKVIFNTEVKEIQSRENIIICHTDKRVRDDSFDKVIVTLPSFVFLKIAPQLPLEYKKKLIELKGLGAINLVLRLKEQFLKDGTYWLSICDEKSPIMAIVEHTNFMDKRYYNNEHIVYIGNYVPHDHPYMKMSKEELLKTYAPYLKKINPNFELCPFGFAQDNPEQQSKDCILNFELFKAPFAQPIIPVNYSKIIPPFETPLKNVYLANIQQVYPWDRGTNYAIEMGEKVAKLINTD